MYTNTCVILYSFWTRSNIFNFLNLYSILTIFIIMQMQIGISIMLSFSVFKLRLSDDVPVQSDSIPLINIYFTLCMSFSLSAMIWFSIKNILKENKRVPSFIRYVVSNYICDIMCYNLKNHKKCKLNINSNIF